MINKKLSSEKRQEIDNMLKIVYDALDEKGYNAVSQIWGYLLSDDGTYITTYNNARKLITSFERDDIGSRLLEKYFGL